MSFPLSTGQISVQGYTTATKVGEGPNSIVYTASKTSSRDKFALKVSKHPLSPLIEEPTYQQFIQDHEFLKQAKHPNILNQYEIYKTNEGYLGVVMEFSERGSIMNFVRNQANIKPTTLKQIMLQLIDGLEYLHSNDKLHRNLKPENIFQFGESQIKIADLGSTNEFIQNYAPGHSYVEPKTMYVPPESLADPECYTKLSDIYCLGVVCYILAYKAYPSSLYYSAPLEKMQDPNSQYNDIQISEFPKKWYNKYSINKIITGFLEVFPKDRLSLKEAKELLEAEKNDDKDEIVEVSEKQKSNILNYQPLSEQQANKQTDPKNQNTILSSNNQNTGIGLGNQEQSFLAPKPKQQTINNTQVTQQKSSINTQAAEKQSSASLMSSFQKPENKTTPTTTTTQPEKSSIFGQNTTGGLFSKKPEETKTNPTEENKKDTQGANTSISQTSGLFGAKGSQSQQPKEPQTIAPEEKKSLEQKQQQPEQSKPSQNSGTVSLTDNMVREFEQKGIHTLAEEGDIVGINYYIQLKKTSPDIQNQNGISPLMRAVKRGQYQCAKTLIESFKANVKLLDIQGWNAFLHAIASGNIQLIDYLYNKAKCDPHIIGKDQQTALGLACKFGHFEIVRYLVEQCKVDQQKESQLPFYAACGSGSNIIIEYLITKLGYDPNKSEHQIKLTPLMTCCLKGKLETAQLLCEKYHANAKYQQEGGKVTALHLACQSGNNELVQYLIEKQGADIEAEDQDKNRPLHFAIKSNSTEIVKNLLIAYNANPSAFNSENRGALSFCAMNKNLELMKLFVKGYKLDLTIPDKSGMNPLMFSAGIGSLDIVKYIHEQNVVDINAQNAKGQTAIMLACMGGFKETIQYLFETAKADLAILNASRKNCLMYAAYGASIEVVKYLLSLQLFDINEKTLDGQTAAMFACLGGKLDNIKYFYEELKCDPNEREVKAGFNALFLGVQSKNVVVVDYLINKFCLNPNSNDNKLKITPALFACMCGAIQVLVYLYQSHRVDLSIKDPQGNSCVLLCTQKVNVEGLLYLQNFGADFNEGDNNGTTPLMVAAALGSLPLLFYFVDQVKVNVKARDLQGLTALDYAQKTNNIEATQYLMQFIPLQDRTEENQVPLEAGQEEI